MDQLHRPDERITIRWPGGPHDYVIEFEKAEPLDAIRGWLYLYGLVVQPSAPQFRTRRGFYCRPVGDREYTMLPKRP